jgi:hypothetical protein
MSLRNRRTAVAAAIGVLAGGVPVGTASALPGHGADPVPTSSPSLPGVPANGIDLPAPGQPSDGTGTQDGGGSTPPIDPAVAAAQCAQAAIPSTLPIVITCGPVTINVTFNTTTTTITTVAAPITAANGPITTPLPNPVTTTVTNPAPAGSVPCKPSRPKKAKGKRPTGRKVSVIVHFGPRPRN